MESLVEKKLPHFQKLLLEGSILLDRENFIDDKRAI